MPNQSENFPLQPPDPQSEQAPLFSYPLVPAEYEKTGLYTFAGLDGQNYIVRHHRSFNTFEEAEEGRLRAERRLSQLITGRDEETDADTAAHPVPVAPPYLFVGENQYGRAELLVATRQLDGENAGRQTFIDAPEIEAQMAAVKFDSLIQNLSGYFGDRIEAGEPFLDDIVRLEQYVYGKLQPSDTEPDFYLVDTEPRAATPDEPVNLSFLIGHMKEMVTGMEQRLPAGVSIEASREAVAALIDLILEHYPERKSDLEVAKKELLEGPDEAAPKMTKEMIAEAARRQKQLLTANRRERIKLPI